MDGLQMQKASKVGDTPGGGRHGATAMTWHNNRTTLDNFIKIP